MFANITSNAAGSDCFSDTEHLNTPRLIADSTGAAVWKWDLSEPFGINGPDENPAALGVFEFDLRFPGQVWNKETQTSYNYLRDCYDPALGRYCQSDPIGVIGLHLHNAPLNLFTYANSSPIAFSDPSGLLLTSCFKCYRLRKEWDRLWEECQKTCPPPPKTIDEAIEFISKYATIDLNVVVRACIEKQHPNIEKEWAFSCGACVIPMPPTRR